MAGIFQFFIGLDRAVFHFFNSAAGAWRPLDWAVKAGADDHIIPVIMTVTVLSLVLFARDHDSRERDFRCVICALAAVVLSMLLLYAMNRLFFRPRPFSSYPVSMLFYHNTDSAFPSNAATLAFTLAFATLLYRRRVGAVMLALACLVGLCRVTAGVHYPADIIAGAVLGLGCVLLVKAAEPAFSPVSRACNRALYRVLCAWEPPPARYRRQSG
ncbi:MAG: phosphatase PAP2 family protein [Actinobacteria bacterium]|nr:phosphatase PAP2 family protein [Actinomycetota bacterium]MBU1942087.1 phosphatase PAP2 family protein [Actinomycetota bacterium]MBU2687348.1 phosphatase PAP2 family protein [Actinomycetota bacterium]